MTTLKLGRDTFNQASSLTLKSIVDVIIGDMIFLNSHF